MNTGMPVYKKAPGDGIVLNAAIWESTRPPILCIHGLSANCRSFDLLLPVLWPARRVIVPDLRGRGRSDKPASGYSIEHHVRDLRNLMHGLGISRAAVLGHSLGAAIGLALGARHPELVERLILLDGGGQLEKEHREKVTEAIRPSLARLGRDYATPEAYLELMKKAPVLQPWNMVIETYLRYELERTDQGWSPSAMPEHMQEEMDNLGRTDIGLFYSGVRCPVLILAATEGLISAGDTLLPRPMLEKMQKAMPQAQTVILEGANHYSVLFQPDTRRDQAIARFL